MSVAAGRRHRGRGYAGPSARDAVRRRSARAVTAPWGWC